MTQAQPTTVTDIAEHRLDAVFSALSDPVRRAILEMIAERELLVSEIASAFDISLQAVSRHIQVLVRAGLVQQQRSGRIISQQIYTTRTCYNRRFLHLNYKGSIDIITLY